MKKNLLWMLAAILTCGTSAFTACSDDNTDNPVVPQVTYSVNGISDRNGQMAYLYNMNIEKCIDSVKVVDGKFSFNGSIDQDALIGVSIQKLEAGCWLQFFFNDGTPVTANLNDSTLQGSPLNTRLSEYDKEINRPYYDIYIKVLAMSEEEQEAKAEEIMEALDQAFAEMLVKINQLYIDERNTLIPVAFAMDYFYGNGYSAYDQLVQEGVFFVNHPYVKYARDYIAEEFPDKK